VGELPRSCLSNLRADTDTFGKLDLPGAPKLTVKGSESTIRGSRSRR
jgi:hypothetical protein